MSQGRELKAQLFIEGKSVPFLGATILNRTQVPTTATINMVPLREINDIAPRTMVHIMVKDFTAPSSIKPWVLAFEGEVYGHSMGKNSYSRQFSLFCMDVSNYWDNAKQYYLNSLNSSGDATSLLLSEKTKDEAKSQNIKTTETLGGARAYLVRRIMDALKDNKTILQAILEVVKEVEEANAFFRYNNQRYRINDRMISRDSGKLEEIFKFDTNENLFNVLLGKGPGGTITIRQILNMLMGLIFHDFTSVAVPSKVDSADISTGIGINNKQTVGSLLFKPNSFMLPPPKSNVLYPDQYDNFSFTRNFFHEVTRLKFQPNITSIEKKALGNLAIPLNNTLFAPSGFSDYRTKNKGDTEGTQNEAPTNQGNYGDKTTAKKSSNVLRDNHFLSKEEVIKGIFLDTDGIMPASQALSKSFGDDQTAFYQQAADYLYFKKRYYSRQLSASGQLNLAPVPGMSFLLMDNSEAEQHVLSVLEGITHNISPTQGGSTSYELSAGRLVEEKDIWDKSFSEPPIPPWFDPKIFGERRTFTDADIQTLPKDDRARLQYLVTQESGVNDFGNGDLEGYYKSLLGHSEPSSHLGARPITSAKFPTVLSAVLELNRLYKDAKLNGDISTFIGTHTRRDYVKSHEIFKFLGADLTEEQENASNDDRPNQVYRGSIFDGDYLDQASEEDDSDIKLKPFFRDAQDARREFLKPYRNKLFQGNRGFRG